MHCHVTFFCNIHKGRYLTISETKTQSWQIYNLSIGEETVRFGVAESAGKANVLTFREVISLAISLQGTEGETRRKNVSVHLLPLVPY